MHYCAVDSCWEVVAAAGCCTYYCAVDSCWEVVAAAGYNGGLLDDYWKDDTGFGRHYLIASAGTGNCHCDGNCLAVEAAAGSCYC